MTNNYEGKTAGQVWGEWSPKQKSHFIKDHYPEKVGDERFAIIKAKFEDIPANIQKGLEAHISEESYAKGGEVGQKYYNTMKNVGKSKYVINYHDGKKKHNDGSLFYDIEIFSNKNDFEKREKQLIKEGYKYQYENGGIINQYEGKTPEEVWEAWTVEQRLHFLNDHNDQLSAAHRIKKGRLSEIAESNFSELGMMLVAWLEKHVSEGEYEHGGIIEEKYVVVSEKIYPDEVIYWTIMSKPVSFKEEAEILKDHTSKVDGETLKVVTLKEAKEHKHIVGKEYLEYGGSLSEQNNQMVGIQVKEVAHYAKEIEESLKGNDSVPAWVVAKTAVASGELSDVAHYLDGVKGEEFAEGGRVFTDSTHRKTKETWGKNNLSEMYENNIDLLADVHDYIKDLEKISPEYANQFKKELIGVTNNGNWKTADGSGTIVFKKGGTLSVMGKTFSFGEKGVVKGVRDYYTNKLLKEVDINGAKYTRNSVYGTYNNSNNSLLTKHDLEEKEFADGGNVGSEPYDTAISEAEPIIGFTSSGKPVYESLPATDERYTYNNFDSKDHAEASMIHMESELSTLPMDKRDELSADHYRQTDEYKQGQLNAQMEEDELNARLQKEAEEDELLEQQHTANGVKVYIPSLQKEGVASFKVGEGVYVKFPDASDGYFKESDLVKLDDKEWLSEAKEEEFTNDNIDVFGYETKNFDISEKALDQFKSAIDKIEEIRENETQFAKKSKALKDAAEKLDVVLGMHKKVIEEKEPLTNDELRSLMHELVYFTVNDYKADVLIDFSIIIDSVIEIVTTKEKPSAGTIAKVLMVSAINPLSTQLRKETGEGYSSDAFDEEQLDGFSVLRHKASGKTFAVFQKEYYSKAGAPKIREDLDFILSNDIFGITGFDRQYEGGGEINLHSGHLGNGLTYWDSNNEVHGDYKTVAHISPSGVISYYYKHLPDHLRKQIESDAERIKNGELKYEFGGKMKDGGETNDDKKHCSIITFEDLHVKVIPGKHSYKDVLNSHKELPKNIEHIEFTESNSVKAFEEFSKNLVEEKFGSTFIEGNPITESERDADGEGVLIIKSIGILEDGKNVHYCPEELTWKEDGHDNDDEPGDDEDEFAKGGELEDWQERLKGKTVDLYQNGDKNNSSEREIIDISVAPSHFKNRDVILTFSDRLESKFPLSKLEKFSEGYKVEIKGVKEPYVIQLVPSDVELPFKKGGTIPNNYEGKTPEEVWDNEWTVDQKKHFYLDNYMGNNRLTPKDISNAMLIGGGNKKGFATKFIDLTDNLQKAITEHVKYGQYKTGGELLKSAKAGLHKLEIGAKKVATKVAAKSKVVGKKVAAKSKKIAHSAAVTFAEKSAAIAKKLEGSDVPKKYQKVYGKKFDKKEAKVAGNKIAGAMVHKGKKK